jgi:hypothetical protein
MFKFIEGMYTSTVGMHQEYRMHLISVSGIYTLQTDYPKRCECFRERQYDLHREWLYWCCTQTHTLSGSLHSTTPTRKNWFWGMKWLRLLLKFMMASIQVVFVSPFEHHSNLLPWREIGAEAGD